MVITTALDEIIPIMVASLAIEAAADTILPHRHDVSIENAEEVVAAVDLAVFVVDGAVMTTRMTAIVIAAAEVAGAVIDLTVEIEVVIEVEIVIGIVIEIELRVIGIGIGEGGMKVVVLRVTITADHDRAVANAIVTEMTVEGRTESEVAEMTMMILLGLIESTILKLGKRSTDGDAAKVGATRGAGVMEADVDMADRLLNKREAATRGTVAELVTIPRSFIITGIFSIVCLVIVMAAK
jgi:hypothetical protein